MASHSKAPPRSGGKRGGKDGEDVSARQRALYALPLNEFTRARDALAKELASKGRTKDAQETKKLKRPVLTAWVINQLVHRHPEDVEGLLDSARALEKAHRRALSGLAAEPFKEANRAFQQALDVLMKDVNALLSETQRTATGDLIRQVDESLRAASLGTEEERATLSQGMLTQPLSSSGFGAFSPLLPVGATPRPAQPRPAKPSPSRAPEKALERAAPAPSPAGGKVLRGPWAPRDGAAEAPAHTPPAPRHQAPAPPPHPPKKAVPDTSAAEARRQREAELRQLRREAKQQVTEAERTERSTRQAIVRTKAALRTLAGQTRYARQTLEAAEARVSRAREALEAAEEQARRAHEDVTRAEQAEQAQAEEVSRADEQAEAAQQALTQARRHLEQAESRLSR